jgi:molybdate-binding protein
VDALRALHEGRCVMAGFHTATNLTRGTLTERTCKPLLQPELHNVIGFAQRTQGLMVAPGNPLGIQSLPDVQRTGARLANRAMGSGTRLWLDDSLAQAGLRAADIQGYDRTEPSHTAVAQAVACGSADVGLGTELAAQSRSLDFIPLVTEKYHLVCLTSALELPGIAALRILLQSPQWQHALAGLAGHEPAQCGAVLSLDQVLPWWQIKNKKRHQPT